MADKHAPIKSKTITECPAADWYTTEFAQEKRLKRKLETHYIDAHAPQMMLMGLTCGVPYTVACFYVQIKHSTSTQWSHAGDQKQTLFNKPQPQITVTGS